MEPLTINSLMREETKNKKGVFPKTRLFIEFAIDSKIVYSPSYYYGLLRSVSGFLVHTRRAHRTLNLAPK